MTIELLIRPRGHLRLGEGLGDDPAATGEGVLRRVQAAFEQGRAQGMLHLATVELTSALPEAFAWLRAFSRRCLLSACAQAVLKQPTPPPTVEHASCPCRA